MQVQTPVGLAEVTWWEPGPDAPAQVQPAARGLLLLGHGAGGGITAPDLQATAELAGQLGYAVGLVEQPYRVAGRRMAAPGAALDTAFETVIAAARERLDMPQADPRPLLLGGRSSGARVACRTAAASGAAGVLALAFPLQPVRRPTATRTPPSRLPELLGAGVPVLVVQGERDAFGSADTVRAAVAEAEPAPAAAVRVEAAEGADHALRKGVPWPTVIEWLAGFLG